MKRDKTKISVVMATYNGETYLREQLESILNQSLKVDEIIVCDDGSKDATHSILVEYKNNYPDIIKYSVNEENLGYAKNFWNAIMKASHEIIVLSDQDDIWDENKVEIVEDIFMKLPEAQALNFGYRIVDTNGNRIVNKKFRHFKDNGKINKVTFKEFVKSPRYPGMSMAFKRSVYDEICNVEINLVTAHDWMINQQASGNSGMFFIDKVVTSYRQHGLNTFGVNASASNEKIFERRLAVISDEILNYKHLMIMYKNNYYIKKLYQVGNKRLECFKTGNVLRIFTNYLINMRYIAFRGLCGDLYVAMFGR